MNPDPYPDLLAALATLLGEERDPIANAANTSALLMERLADLNWVGFWMNNMIIVTIGNIVGALFFVGVIYWVAFRKEIAALK